MGGLCEHEHALLHRGHASAGPMHRKPSGRHTLAFVACCELLRASPGSPPQHGVTGSGAAGDAPVGHPMGCCRCLLLHGLGGSISRLLLDAGSTQSILFYAGHAGTLHVCVSSPAQSWSVCLLLVLPVTPSSSLFSPFLPPSHAVCICIGLPPDSRATGVGR